MQRNEILDVSHRDPARRPQQDRLQRICFTEHFNSSANDSSRLAQHGSLSVLRYVFLTSHSAATVPILILGTFTVGMRRLYIQHLLCNSQSIIGRTLRSWVLPDCGENAVIQMEYVFQNSLCLSTICLFLRTRIGLSWNQWLWPVLHYFVLCSTTGCWIEKYSVWTSKHPGEWEGDK